MKRMKKKLHRCTAVLLLFAMLLTMQAVPALAETTAAEAAESRQDTPEAVGAGMPANPVHHCNKENGEEDTTDWSYVYFGSYPQTEVTGDALTSAITGASYNDTGDAWVNGTKYRRISKSDTNYDGYFGSNTYRYFKWERIKWRVLQNNGTDLFLLADRALDCKNYNETGTSITWEYCTMRKWLNENFYQSAFTKEEQAAILPQTVANIDNFTYGTEGGNDTCDNVYLLSIAEVSNYAFGFCDFDYTASRWIQASDFSYAMGAYTYSGTTTNGQFNCDWWLRSVGNYEHMASFILSSGWLHNSGSNVNRRTAAVVPALHINLSSDLWSMTDDGSSGSGGNGSGTGGDSQEDILDKSSDEYIIEQVKKYTSDEQYTQCTQIMNSNTTDEEKFRRLNELFENNGITDVQEGIRYLSNTSSYRYDYLYLTTDEIYCSYNWANWLNTTKKGNLARGLLYADGLIFNHEAMAYLDPATYIESDYPGVKKNKTLLKTILESNNKNVVNDVLGYSNKIAKELKNILKLNSEYENEQLKALIHRIETSSSEAEIEKLKIQFLEKMVEKIKKNGSDHVNLEGELFSEALNYSATILKFTGATVEDIIDILNLNDDIKLYKQNKHFLMTIYKNKDISWEMRAAAWSLLDDIENGYWNKTVAVMNDIFLFEKDVIEGKLVLDQTVLQSVVKKAGVSSLGKLIEQAVGTLTLGIFISNLVVNTGDFVKQAAYTQGYAELAVLFAMELEKDKQNFLKNSDAKNAWKFLEDYTILWNLRYGGEEQYLKMNEIKMLVNMVEVKSFRYDEKQEVVRDNLSHLEKCKFEMASGYTVPQSVSYVKKAVINCPVDVYVYTKSGKLVAILQDGKESDVTNEYGRFAVVHQSYNGEYAKVICQSTDELFDIKLVAVSGGLVDYQSYDGDEMKAFEKVKVEKGSVIYVSENSYNVDNNADGVIEESGTLLVKDNNAYINVNEIYSDVDALSLKSGESEVIGVKVLPQEATNTNINWTSMDQSVAIVKNGVVTGISPGKTTIIITASDSDDVEKSISVVVEKVSDDGKKDEFNESETEKEIGGNVDEKSEDISSQIVLDKSDNSNINKISIQIPSLQLAAGKKVKLKANVMPANVADKSIRWISGYPKRASVSQDGILTLKKAGIGKQVMIIAESQEDSRIKAICTVTVMKHAVKKITLLASSKTIKAGKTLKLKAKVTTTGRNANKKLKFTSSNTKYATVSQKGVVKTKKAGRGKNVTITAVSTDGSNKKAKIRLKLK